jgi:hypothetical protein
MESSRRGRYGGGAPGEGVVEDPVRGLERGGDVPLLNIHVRQRKILTWKQEIGTTGKSRRWALA